MESATNCSVRLRGPERKQTRFLSNDCASPLVVCLCDRLRFERETMERSLGARFFVQTSPKVEMETCRNM